VVSQTPLALVIYRHQCRSKLKKSPKDTHFFSCIIQKAIGDEDRIHGAETKLRCKAKHMVL
jgi:hypothetical protein